MRVNLLIKSLHWIMTDISHIIDNIYLGNFESSVDVETLNKYNICAIVRILDPEMIHDIVREDTEPNINYHYVELLDHPSQNITKHFPQFLKFVNENKNTNILIHCLMGISRSASFTALVLVKNYNMDITTALKIIKEKRPNVKPLKEFIQQVIQYTYN